MTKSFRVSTRFGWGRCRLNVLLSVEGAEHRDEETWATGCDGARIQPDYTIARWGYGTEEQAKKAVMGEIPCHGDVFHIQHQCRTVVTIVRQEVHPTAEGNPRAGDGSSQTKAQGNPVSKELTQARQAESQQSLEQRSKPTQWLKSRCSGISWTCSRSSGKVI